MGYAGKLGQWLRPSRQARVNDALEGLPVRYRPLCRPQLTGLDIGAKVSLATRVLRSMGLDGYLAPLVLLVAMIGAIVLTLRHKPGVRRQVIADLTLHYNGW